MWNAPMKVTTGAWSMHQQTSQPVFRTAAETTLLGKDQGWGGTRTIVHGIGCQGADFWAVLPVDKFNYLQSVNRFTYQPHALDHSSATFEFVGAGKQGPVPTCHLRLLEESLQDAEARIFVQDALLDHKDKLGPDLARRCKEVCDGRTRQFRFYSAAILGGYQRVFPSAIFNEVWYTRNTAQLYELTDEVAKALGK